MLQRRREVRPEHSGRARDMSAETIGDRSELSEYKLEPLLSTLSTSSCAHALLYTYKGLSSLLLAVYFRLYSDILGGNMPSDSIELQLTAEVLPPAASDSHPNPSIPAKYEHFGHTNRKQEANKSVRSSYGHLPAVLTDHVVCSR